ncbi:MAG: ribosome maturation protein RimP [Betaproteobacteria bacterium SG8_39]|nr:MAG: ribosome maturation protein RimP [Betaproteobacteria bacterium SG8_39]
MFARWQDLTGLAELVERAVNGLGFECVDFQPSNRARLLRVFIDRPEGITVDDCAAVSRQLTRVFAVEGVEYDRLEVSSPGLDRPLRKASDFRRFAGQRVEVRMRERDAAGRRRYAGLLLKCDEQAATIEVDGQNVSLALADMERAKLVPDL